MTYIPYMYVAEHWLNCACYCEISSKKQCNDKKRYRFSAPQASKHLWNAVFVHQHAMCLFILSRGTSLVEDQFWAKSWSKLFGVEWIQKKTPRETHTGWPKNTSRWTLSVCIWVQLWGGHSLQLCVQQQVRYNATSWHDRRHLMAVVHVHARTFLDSVPFANYAV